MKTGDDDSFDGNTDTSDDTTGDQSSRTLGDKFHV